MVYKSSTQNGGGGGSGTVTQINTGTGLTGGPITGTGTISVADGAVNSLAGYDNTGEFSGVTVGTGLSLSGGTLSATATAPSFDDLTSGTNTGAAMVVGTGASLATSGSGTIAATSAATVSSANEATDTTCFPLFITASGTQTLQTKNNAGFIYNSNTNALTATTFIGALTGNATSSTVATTITAANEATDTTCFPVFVTAATGDLGPKTNAAFTFNSNTGALGATTLGGTLTTAAQTNITSVGTLTGGATGSGFTVALGTSTITGILGSANGGTANGFTKFSGPASTEKTFTLPNASAAVLTDNAAVTAAQGGTGRQTLTNHGVLIGAATTAITQLAAAAAGTVLTGQGTSSDPAFTATPTLGVAGTTLGSLSISGNTSGTVTMTVAAAAGTWTLTLPPDDGTSGQFLRTDGNGITTWVTGNSGDVVGPGSSTDNAIARFDGTTGKLLQNSGAQVTDSGRVTSSTTSTATTLVTLTDLGQAINGDTTTNPSGPSSNVTFAGRFSNTYTSANNLTGTGHYGGVFSQTDITSGATVATVYNVEARIQATAGVQTTVIGHTVAVQTASEGAAGTIGLIAGYYFPALSDHAYITSKYCFLNAESSAILQTAGVLNVPTISTASGNLIIIPVGGQTTMFGNLIFDNSFGPNTLTIPAGGNINKISITAPATGATLTLADGKTFTASNTITLTGTDGVSANITNQKKRTIGFSATSPVTGQQGSYIRFPVAGTITGWSIIADAGTATVKVWKVASGTAAPTISNVINTSGVALATGTAIISTTTSDFTTTTVTANDMFAFDLTAVATATKLDFQLDINVT